jgi:hypothetical protein
MIRSEAMRRIMLIAAITAALGMATQPAEARDRGFGFRYFSGHASPKLHPRHHALKFHHGSLFGKPRPFKSRHFGHFRHPGLVLKFGDGDFVLRFGHVPHSKHRHFGRRHHHDWLFFGFDQPRRFGRWHDRDFAFADRRGLHAHRQTMPESHGSQGGGLHRGEPPEALLQQLEAMGFRHVPELLRSRDP